jgi:hypothetical protein
MKKILTTAAAVFALVAVSNAQLWIGGNVGFSTQSETAKTKDDSFKQNLEDENGDPLPSMKINFTPKIGFNLNDVMCVGVGLNLATETYKAFDGTADNKVLNKTALNTIGIAPFFRYTFVEFGDFSVFGEAVVNFDLTSVKYKPEEGDNTKGPKIMDLGLDIRPVVAYAISDRITLTADINIFNLGVNFQSVTADPENNKDNKYDSMGFNLGVTDNVFTSGLLNVGLAINL